jgi:hypothetical protein
MWLTMPMAVLLLLMLLLPPLLEDVLQQQGWHCIPHILCVCSFLLLPCDHVVCKALPFCTQPTARQLSGLHPINCRVSSWHRHI